MPLQESGSFTGTTDYTPDNGLVLQQLFNSMHKLYLSPVQVSSLEMATAVREMLSAAGMPIDLEQAAMLEKALKLQENLDSESAKLLKAEKVVYLSVSQQACPHLPFN